MIAHPELDSWRRWQRRRQGLARRAWRAARPRAPQAPGLVVSGPHPQVLVALDWLAPSSRSALLDPVAALLDCGVAVALLAFAGCDTSSLPGSGWQAGGALDQLGPGCATVLSTGHYMGAGGLAWRWAAGRGARTLVVQHGALTPFAPPAPPGAHLLAWTEADAGFAATGRGDLTWRAVGSQLLWRAAQDPRPGDPAACLTFLGQLHGAELPRRTTLRTLRRLASLMPFAYQPHPAETDLASRLQHARWRRQGLVVSAPGGGVGALPGPVAAIFSTGLLEAAAGGRPAYGFCAEPPTWVIDFWRRYRVGRLDLGEVTTVEPPGREPALAVAEEVLARCR